MKKSELIIKMALDSPEGRTALADAMVAPIKASLGWHSIGKKLIGALAPLKKWCDMMSTEEFKSLQDQGFVSEFADYWSVADEQAQIFNI